MPYGYAQQHPYAQYSTGQYPYPPGAPPLPPQQSAYGVPPPPPPPSAVHYANDGNFMDQYRK